MSRILIAYLIGQSGHHSAACALEAALRNIDPCAETLCIDLLHFTHPRLARVIQKTYLGTIRRTPELWEAVYDRKVVEYLTRRLRNLIHRGHSRALEHLMVSFRPDVVVCTQAYPLAVLREFASKKGEPLDLWGVVTDFVPHRFWVLDGGTRYVVPTQAAADRLVLLGVARSRIRLAGIPIHPDFEAAATGDVPLPLPDLPRVLVMGGGRGLGIRYRTLRALDKSRASFSMEVIAGKNDRLRRQLAAHRRQFRHPLRVHGFVHDMAEPMRRAAVLLSKPGGLTSAEALAMGLPMVLVRPLPGQEKGNTDVLVRHGAAVHVGRERDVGPLITALLSKPDLLDMMKARARDLGCPEAARLIAAIVLGSSGTTGEDTATGETS